MAVQQNAASQTGSHSEGSARKKILIINPNSTKNMTDSLQSSNGDGSSKASYHYFTAPSGPSSINNEDDAAESSLHCIPSLQREGYLEKYDGFLVACYSQHPLVPWLKEHVDVTRAAVTGIFEASVDKSLKTVQSTESFGIVSTGKVWEKLLSEAVDNYFKNEIGHAPGDEFAGVETTGLNATELHDAPAEEVKTKMKQATKRLVKGRSVGAVCLGCAGMVGMDEIVREALQEQLGEEKGASVEIVDGVKSGIAWLENNLPVH